MSSATEMSPPPAHTILTTAERQVLVDRLSRLDTALLCDADKTLLNNNNNNNNYTTDGSHLKSSYDGLRLMTGLKPLNHAFDPVVMVGFAHTVQFTTPNDFLPVLRGLAEAQRGQVLVVHTLDSTRAVAGGLFGQEALRTGLSGIVVDGPMRDVASLANNPPNDSSTNIIRVFCKSVTPYSGTIQSPGETQCSIQCGGVTVHPDDIVVGDADGIVVGSIHTFTQLIQVAEDIQKVETALVKGMENGTSLSSMTNLEQHLKLRLSGKESNLSFLLDPS